MRNLVVILGDQLNQAISALEDFDIKQDAVLMVEVIAEAEYVKHHQKKLVFVFSAMRHFAKDLRAKKFKVHYTELLDDNNTGNFSDEIKRYSKALNPKRIIITEASEWRVQQILLNLQQKLPMPVELRPDHRFFCDHESFANWAQDRKQLRMEFFYRELRKRYSILMDNNKPLGGQWNFDNANRKALPKNITIPAVKKFKASTIVQSVTLMVAEHFSEHFGHIKDFHYAVTSAQAETVLDDFITQRLPYFGDYQDAMQQGEAWLFHSHISFYLNNGLLLPKLVVAKVEQAYRAGRAPLNAVEGFIRQVLGWREFVRGIYWLKMPDYQTENFLQADKALPDFYWTGETKLNCLKQCITETQENAYAHHIQRLMVLGNFALLAGLAPEQVQEWYLLVYADAYEWVEMPNVVGMILFADGGLLASKPYIASGSYINKMSNYCQSCHYKVKQKTGADACPFNYLYWHFLHKHKNKLQTNQRLAFPYKTLAKMDDEKIATIEADAKQFLESLY